MKLTKAKQHVHAPAGLGITFCGMKGSRVQWSGDERDVTCPRCRAALSADGGER